MAKKKEVRTLLAHILEVGNQPVELMYKSIDTIAEKYDLTYRDVMSILMNYRTDIHTKALKEKYKSPLERNEK